MSADTLSRLSLLTQTSRLEGLATLLLLLALIVAAAPRLLAAMSPVPRRGRWYAPVPSDLPARGSTEPYGAPALQSIYRPALLGGVSAAAASHILLALAIAILLRSVVRPIEPVPPAPIDSTRITLGPEVTLPDRWTPDTGGGGEAGIPLVIPTFHTIFRPVPDAESTPRPFDPDPDDLLSSADGDENGSPFAAGPNGGRDQEGWGAGPAAGLFDADRDDDPSPDSFRPMEAAPILVSLPQPEYPTMARLAGVEGRVELLLLVGRDGHVRDVRVRKSIRGLDEASVAAARGAVFRPALWRHRPISVWVALPMEYRLDGAEDR